MHLVLLGLSHHTAPLALRERLAFPRSRLHATLATLVSRTEAGDAVLLSTCNRSEVYATCAEPDRAAAALADVLCSAQGVPLSTVRPHLYTRTDADAARHLFRVAAGLDSLVVGEPEILGQVKEAYRIASEAQGTGAFINRLFHGAFGVGKRVRSETALAEGAVSVNYAALTLAKKIFGGLEGLQVLVIGSGDMARLAAHHFQGKKVAGLRIATRNEDRAAALAAEVGGVAIPWSTRERTLAESDVVISATGGSEVVLAREAIAAATAARRGRPLFLLDMAVPRDIDASSSDLEEVFLYNLDDLRSIVQENLDRRAGEIAAAEAIVQDEVEAFMAWMRARHAVPTVVALRQRFEQTRQSELERLSSRFSGLPPDARARVDEVTRLIVEKLLLTPTAQLKAIDDRETMRAYSAALRRLFDLDDQEEAQGVDATGQVRTET
jgi:glutamyl-tRNA reductase